MILIAAGSNMPFRNIDSSGVVLAAFSALGRLGEPKLMSALYRSPAWPDPSDPPFVNGVMSLNTDLTPEALLAAMHAIEAGFGRRRGRKNAPRTLDLDLLAYKDEIRSETGGGLVLPHPRMAERAFVLAPLCDIAPTWRHPVTGLTARAMLDALAQCDAEKIR